jgi:hypothetical protein
MACAMGHSLPALRAWHGAKSESPPRVPTAWAMGDWLPPLYEPLPESTARRYNHEKGAAVLYPMACAMGYGLPALRARQDRGGGLSGAGRRKS